MKKTKGISLITLVITIIVMIILAGAVILSLSNTNIVNRSNEAVDKSNLKNLEEKLQLAYVDWMVSNPNDKLTSVSQLTGFDVATVPEDSYVAIENGVPKIKIIEELDPMYYTLTETTFVLKEPYRYNTFGAYGESATNLEDLPKAFRVPEGVTYLDEHAFDSTLCTKVILPSTLQHIGYNAFQNSHILSIVIPEAVTTIDNNAFMSDYINYIYVPAILLATYPTDNAVWYNATIISY